MQNENINIEVVDLGQVKKKVNITIPVDMVKKEMKAAYANMSANAVIPGFRKGAVPINILKTRFGAQIAEDVKVRLVESSYPRALNEKKLLPVVQPQIEMTTQHLTGNDPFSYAVTVEVNPDVDVDGYRGMTLKKEPIAVDDKDVEVAVERLRESRAEYNDVVRPAKEGDVVLVDFEGFLDGEPVKNGKAKDYPIVIGQKTVLPGFDEGLIGVLKGEAKEINITIPKNYSERHLAGKPVLFKVAVKEVKEKVFPTLDDEFAKDVECEDMGKLREKVREEILKVKENVERERLKNVVLETLLEKHVFDVPDALVRKYASINLNRVMEEMKRGNISPADKNLSPDELSKKYTGIAMRQVKEDIILDAMAAKEQIKISKEQLDGALAHLASMRNASVDELAGRLEREGTMPLIVDGLKHEKVFEIILETAKYE